jgi:hypothetical protein
MKKTAGRLSLFASAETGKGGLRAMGAEFERLAGKHENDPLAV